MSRCRWSWWRSSWSASGSPQRCSFVGDDTAW